MTLVLIYFQRALLLTHSHLMPQKYVRLWFIIQLKMPLFLYRVQAWYLLAVKNCKKLFVCKSSSLLEPLSLQQFRAIFNFAIYMMDGEVRIRKYFNDFQHNHHDYSHKWMRQRATLFFNRNWKKKNGTILKTNSDTVRLQRISNFQPKFVARIQTKLNDLTHISQLFSLIFKQNWMINRIIYNFSDAYSNIVEWFNTYNYVPFE